MTSESVITSVADTALWVAAFRAREGERVDAIFHDPLASILAGERGRKIARSIPHAAAADCLAVPSFRHWILDFDNAGKRRMPNSWAEKLKAAPFLFEVDDWFEFFEQSGWQTRKVITSAEESERVDRPYPFSFPLGLIMHALPKEMSRRILTVSGAVRMERA